MRTSQLVTYIVFLIVCFCSLNSLIEDEPIDIMHLLTRISQNQQPMSPSSNEDRYGRTGIDSSSTLSPEMVSTSSETSSIIQQNNSDEPILSTEFISLTNSSDQTVNETTPTMTVSTQLMDENIIITSSPSMSVIPTHPINHNNTTEAIPSSLLSPMTTNSSLPEISMSSPSINSSISTPSSSSSPSPPSTSTSTSTSTTLSSSPTSTSSSPPSPTSTSSESIPSSSTSTSTSTSPSSIPSSSSSSSSSSQSSPTSSLPRYYSTQESTQHSHNNHTSTWEKYIRHIQAGPFPTVTKLLIVVNFHEPRYEAIPFLENTFFPAFRTKFPIDFDVVFLGPWEDKKYLVIPNHIPIHGHLSYYSLWVAYNLLCVVEQCNYHGFLFMNDDSYVDPQFLMQYDLKQSWTEGSQQMVVNRRWMWYTKKNDKGVLYKDAYANAIRELQQSPWNERCHFDDVKNHRRGMADFFYLVATDMPAYYEMIFVMKKHRVFLEMATPTVNWCLTRNKVENCNHGPMKNRRKCVHMHPVKLRQEGMKEFMMQRLHHLNLDRAPPRMW